MLLTRPQSQVISDTHRFRVVNIGRRGGKTTLAIEEMKACAFARPSRICYIAPTYNQARDIAWEALKKDLYPITIAVNESRLELKVRTKDGGESLILLRGWESIENLRGQAFDFLVLDEVAMVRNFWSNWQEIIRPTLTDRKGQALFISTPKGFNHFYDLYNLEGRDTDYKSFHFTTYDNDHIPKDEIDKARFELTEDRFAQEYLADFRKTEGLVYKEFSREKHVYDDADLQARGQIITLQERIAGVDFGYTNPAAIPFITVDLEKIFWITDEYYHSGRTEDELTDYVSQQKFSKVYPDPENASAIASLRKKGVNVRDVTKGKGSVISGIQLVRELFKANRIRINKKCINLITELESYSYPDKKDQRNEEELPIKEGDHLLDALRYALVTYETVSQTPARTYVPNHPNRSNLNNVKKRAIIPAYRHILPR